MEGFTNSQLLDWVKSVLQRNGQTEDLQIPIIDKIRAAAVTGKGFLLLSDEEFKILVPTFGPRQNLKIAREEMRNSARPRESSSVSPNQSYPQFGFDADGVYWLKLYENCATIYVKLGDILNERSDAIVNAANSRLEHSGGVAKTISDAAGPELSRECNAWLQGNNTLKAGDAMHTKGGELPFDIIHAVAPRASASGSGSIELMRNCMRAILEVATKKIYRSISIPAIGTGIFGWDKGKAAQIYAEELKKFCHRQNSGAVVSGLMDIYLVNIDQRTNEAVLKAIKELESPVSKTENSSRVNKKEVASVDLDYEKKKLSDFEVKAAGILPIRLQGHRLEFLLPEEYKQGMVLNVLGGQAEKGETPEETAIREFHEETADLVRNVKLNLDHREAVYVARGKYALFVVPGELYDDLPTRFQARKKHAEADALHWVPLAHLLIGRKQKEVSLLNGKAVRVSDFLIPLLHDEALFRVVGRVLLRMEMARIDAAKNKLNRAKFEEAMKERFQLALEAPEAPVSPFQVLGTQHPDFVKVKGELPADQQARLTKITKNNVLNRRAEWDKLKRDTNVAQPVLVYHGTPDSWRATAICLNGFDLNIRLHGRALGDGVYSSTDLGVVANYVHGNGAILRLEGLSAKQDNQPTGFCNLTGNVYVWTKPQAISPTHIIDLGNPDPNRPSVDQAIVDEQKRIAGIKKEIAAKQRSFLDAAFKTEGDALALLKKRLGSIHHQPAEMTEDWLKNLVREIGQGSPPVLPIYPHKERIISTVLKAAVTVVIAETGSGKSTQIPQYLLDHVVEPHRKVACLQPRRINAETLYRRVSEERNGIPGEEVGLRLGQGRTDVSAKTRLEFMTHGLFLQKALDARALVAEYGVVIVDEAHERTVEIDMCLAILKKILADKDRQDTFRVVVASATIDLKEANRICSYLAPTADASEILQLPGFTFPVHVDYSQAVDFGKDSEGQTALGTSGAAAVMTSACTSVVLSLLESSQSGNILVFLPGESSINQAIKNLQSALNHGGSSTDRLSGGFELFRGGGEERKERKKQPGRTVGIYPFHSRISNTLKELIQSPKVDQMVIFATNVAETGVTLPGIRFVVDSGLEREVSWNWQSRMNEMSSRFITRSSMNQRAGRAGRTSVGLCIRLFPEEIYDKADVSIRPAITDAAEKATLRLLNLPPNLPLLDDIPEEKFRLALQSLKELEAVDEKDKITEIGKKIIELGLDVHLARFLLACHTFRCLDSGSRIVAMVIASESTAGVLPNKNNGDRMRAYIDQRGDHLTLLQLFKAWERKKGRKAQWCADLGLDHRIFEEAARSLDFLQTNLLRLGLDLSEPGKRSLKDTVSDICCALASAYSGNLIIPKVEKQVASQFVRLTDVKTEKILAENTAAFVQQNGLATANPSPPDSTQPAEQIVKLTNRSSVWHVPSGSLGLFGGIILTDGGKNIAPVVDTVTYITEEEVKKGAETWKKNWDEFTQIVGAHKREVKVFDISKEVYNYLASNSGRKIGALRNKYPSSVLELNKEKETLTVHAPKAVFVALNREVEGILEYVDVPDEVIFQIPPAKVKAFKGVESRRITELRQELKAIVQNAATARNNTPSQKNMLTLDDKTGVLKLCAVGDQKPCLSMLIAHVKNSIFEITEEIVEVPQQLPSQDVDPNERLQKFLIQQLPGKAPATRDDLAFNIAHFCYWQLGCKIYGGFVRDYIIRGDPCNDVDCLLINGNVEDARARLINAAKGWGSALTNQKLKPNATTLFFKAPTGKDVEVDLVDSRKLKLTPPGVDCDVGNLCLTPGVKALSKKVPNADGGQVSLTDSLNHCRKKQFIFFYELKDQTSETRLRKYCDRQWTVLNHLPEDKAALFGPRYQPQPQYNQEWWKFNPSPHS